MQVSNPNLGFARGIKQDRIQSVALAGEADLDSVGGRRRGAAPWAGGADGLAVNVEPGAESVQASALQLVDAAVGAGADVKQEVAVLADDVDQHADDRARTQVTIFVIGTVVTEGTGDAAAGLPLFGLDLVEGRVLRSNEVVVNAGRLQAGAARRSKLR